jgi:hypothetical protein
VTRLAIFEKSVRPSTPVFTVELFFAGTPPLFSKVFNRPIENIGIERMRPAE